MKKHLERNELHDIKCDHNHSHKHLFYKRNKVMWFFYLKQTSTYSVWPLDATVWQQKAATAPQKILNFYWNFLDTLKKRKQAQRQILKQKLSNVQWKEFIGSEMEKLMQTWLIWNVLLQKYSNHKAADWCSASRSFFPYST